MSKVPPTAVCSILPTVPRHPAARLSGLGYARKEHCSKYVHALQRLGMQLNTEARVRRQAVL